MKRTTQWVLVGGILFSGVSRIALAAAPSTGEIYSAPFRCSKSAYATLEQKPQRLSALDDVRLMREQTGVFVECVQEALQSKSEEWKLAHPYALLADLYQQAIPYLDTSSDALLRLRREQIQKVLDQADLRMSQFLRVPAGQKTEVPGSQEIRDLRQWLRGLRQEAEEQASGGMGAFASVVGEAKYALSLQGSFTRQYRKLRTKLCAFKTIVDRELVSRTADPAQLGIPGLPPQVIYCP